MSWQHVAAILGLLLSLLLAVAEVRRRRAERATPELLLWCLLLATSSTIFGLADVLPGIVMGVVVLTELMVAAVLILSPRRGRTR